MARARWAAASAALVAVVLAACGTPAPSPTEPPATASPTPSRAAPPEPPTPSPSDPALAPEDALTRAVWVHLFDDTLKTRAGIEQVVADMWTAHATAVVVEVVRRQDAYYASDVLPRTADPALEPGLDVLQAMIEAAAVRNLEVHAWVPLTPTWHEQYAGLPAPDGWVAAEHGRTAPENRRWVTRTVDGTWTDTLDPALPEVRAHVAAVVGEIAERYDVDGIHLDYARYDSPEHGYHPRALELYRAETGAAGTPAPGDPAWLAWRRAQVDALVAAAQEAIDASGRRPVLSAAVICWGEGPGGPGTPSFADTRAYREVMQDWAGWAERGLVDVLVPMNYFREHDAQQAAWLRQWLAFEAGIEAATGTSVVPGIAGYLNSRDDALAQVGLAMRSSRAVALYSYQGSTNDPSETLWRWLSAVDWSGAP